MLTGGHANDITQAAALLQGLTPQAILADKAYDADALLNSIEAMNAKAVIPSRSNRKVQRGFDQNQYRNRHVIERFFAQGRVKNQVQPALKNSHHGSSHSLLLLRQCYG